MSIRAHAAAHATIVACAALLLGHPYPIPLVLGVAAAAAAFDGLSNRIPNAVSFAGLLVASLAFVAGGMPTTALLLAGIVFCILHIAFDAEQMGGGDVKLVPSLVLASASLGHDPMVSSLVMVWVLLAVALAWGFAMRSKSAPLAAAAPLAVLMPLLLGC